MGLVARPIILVLRRLKQEDSYEFHPSLGYRLGLIVKQTAKLQTIWAWWYTPIILALRRLRQEESQELEVSLVSIVRFCIK